VEYQLPPPTFIAATPLKELFEVLKKTLWQGSLLWIQHFHCICGTDCYPKRKITLNLLRTSILHPQLSAAAHFHGLVDYNKSSFAPPGCKIIAHQKPVKRRTWAPHGQHGYSLGPVMHKYGCQNVYIAVTASERIVDILKLAPHNYQMQKFSSTD
jgi:hypothetical protein